MYSGPLDEQTFVTHVIRFLQQQTYWKNTLMVITCNNSDGWYGHTYVSPSSPSFGAQAGQLNCSGRSDSGTPLTGVNGKPANGRCSSGRHILFLVISP